MGSETRDVTRTLFLWFTVIRRKNGKFCEVTKTKVKLVTDLKSGVDTRHDTTIVGQESPSLGTIHRKRLTPRIRGRYRLKFEGSIVVTRVSTLPYIS